MYLYTHLIHNNSSHLFSSHMVTHTRTLIISKEICCYLDAPVAFAIFLPASYPHDNQLKSLAQGVIQTWPAFPAFSLPAYILPDRTECASLSLSLSPSLARSLFLLQTELPPCPSDNCAPAKRSARAMLILPLALTKHSTSTALREKKA